MQSVDESLLGAIAGSESGSGKMLTSGSRIAVVGAGPSGTLFSYFLLDMAESLGLELSVDIYEPRRFCHRGPAGCNHCGGVISESLVQRLATEGVMLPDGVVQRGIESYTLHMDVGDVQIRTPVDERRIAAVYRGNGPRESEPTDSESFDGYLLRLASEKGANPVHRLVANVRNEGDRMHVECADGFSDDYELVALACGVNSKLVADIEAQNGAFRKPQRTKAFICEFRLGRQTIRETLGPSMHVFLLDIPRLEFAALIPKGEFVTLALLGEDVDDELIEHFFNSPEVMQCFPGGRIPAHACHCYPRMNIRGTRPPFADRLVMIGDCGTTRLFKDGIGAAYRAAKAAARTAVFRGVSAEDFAAYYRPTTDGVKADNRYGKLLFTVAGLIRKARFARRGVLHMTASEQSSAGSAKRMSGVLWDLFSGSAPYKDVFMRTLHPAYIGDLVWHLAAGNLDRRGATKDAPAAEKRHDAH